MFLPLDIIYTIVCVKSIKKMTSNVPRVPEVGDQREPIWAERSAAGYSLLGDENNVAREAWLLGEHLYPVQLKLHHHLNHKSQ